MPNIDKTEARSVRSVIGPQQPDTNISLIGELPGNNKKRKLTAEDSKTDLVKKSSGRKSLYLKSIDTQTKHLILLPRKDKKVKPTKQDAVTKFKKEKFENPSIVGLKNERSKKGQRQLDITPLTGGPDSGKYSTRTKLLFLEEIDLETRRLAALPRTVKKRKPTAKNSVSQWNKEKCEKSSIVGLKNERSEKGQRQTDITPLTGGPDSEKYSTGRKSLFLEEIDLETRRLAALPRTVKKRKPTAENSVSQLNKEKCEKSSIVDLKNERSEKGQRQTDITPLTGGPDSEKYSTGRKSLFLEEIDLETRRLAALPKTVKKRKPTAENSSVSQLNKEKCEKSSVVGLKNERSEKGQRQTDITPLTGGPDSEKYSTGRKSLFLEEIDLETRRLAALPRTVKKRKPTAKNSVSQLNKEKCEKSSVVGLKNERSEKGQRHTDITPLTGGSDSEKYSTGRKSLFLEEIDLETRRLAALPRTVKKIKPTAKNSVSQLNKEKCVEPSIVGVNHVRGEIGQRRPEIISLIGGPDSETNSSGRKLRLLDPNVKETNQLSLARNEKKRKLTADDGVSQLNKKRCVKPSIVGFKYVRDVKDNVLEIRNHPVSNLSSGNSVKISEETKAPAKNRATQAPIRCPDFIQFGNSKVKTWFSAQFPQEPDAKTLIFCEYCLVYTQCKSVMRRHMRYCNWRTPPGTEIYRNESLSVFEVDGNIDKIYCDILCRIGKLFLNVKTLDYGVEPFRFYILTKNDGFGNHLVGYFSKNKQRQDNFNVNCIIVMPQYQRKGYGRLLIEFSYLLSIIEKKPGTPETPLTVLGQKAYNSYWKSVILEYLEKYTNSDSIHIKDVIKRTGLMGQDIINTFHSLNFVVEVFNRTTICIDWNIVDAHMQRKKLSKQVQIEREKLNWTP